MAVTPKILIHPKQAEAAQTTQYTAELARAIIDKFTVTNTTASTQTITVNLVSTGSAAASNTVISARSIAAGETYTCPELVGHILDVGGSISTLASAGSALTIRASGREIT